MFCRNILLLWNILPFKPLFVCKASSASVHSFFLAKQSIFNIWSIFNISINLHVICISNIVQQIEVILLDPVHHIIHSIRAHDQTTQVLQILLVNYIIATWFRLTLHGQWFSAVTQSNCCWTVSTESDCTTCACTGDGFHRFDSNVDHHRFDRNHDDGGAWATMTSHPQLYAAEVHMNDTESRWISKTGLQTMAPTENSATKDGTIRALLEFCVTLKKWRNFCLL